MAHVVAQCGRLLGFPSASTSVPIVRLLVSSRSVDANFNVLVWDPCHTSDQQPEYRIVTFSSHAFAAYACPFQCPGLPTIQANCVCCFTASVLCLLRRLRQESSAFRYRRLHSAIGVRRRTWHSKTNGSSTRARPRIYLRPPALFRLCQPCRGRTPAAKLEIMSWHTVAADSGSINHPPSGSLPTPQLTLRFLILHSSHPSSSILCSWLASESRSVNTNTCLPDWLAEHCRVRRSYASLDCGLPQGGAQQSPQRVGDPTFASCLPQSIGSCLNALYRSIDRGRGSAQVHMKNMLAQRSIVRCKSDRLRSEWGRSEDFDYLQRQGAEGVSNHSARGPCEL